MIPNRPIIVDKHRSDITKLLKELCVDGYLIAEGIGRGTKYKLSKDFIDNTPARSNVSNPASKSTNLASNRRPKLTQSAVNELQNKISEVCVEYLSLVEIAAKVNRSISHLKAAIIPLLLQKGLLEREFPNTPRHRKQQYRKK